MADLKKDHKHLIIRATISNSPTTGEELENWCKNVVTAVGMNVITGPHSCYSDIPGNEGYTCIAILDFSHIAIHFWDKREEPFFEFDLFSCKTFDINIPINYIKQFGIKDINIHLLDRNEFKFKKIFVVYKTTNLLNGNYYIGKHGFWKLEDSYLGSGKLIKQAIKKYGKNNFVCECLKFFENEQEAYDYEKSLLTDDVLNDEKCYNIISGGVGGFQAFTQRCCVNKNGQNKNIDFSELDQYLQNGWVRGKIFSDKWYEQQRNKEPLSEKTKQKISQSLSVSKRHKEAARRPKSEQTKFLIRKNHRFNNGGRVSLETRAKQSAALKGKYIGKPGTTTGKKFFNNGHEERLFFIEQVPDGWQQGRLKHSIRGLRNNTNV